MDEILKVSKLNEAELITVRDKETGDNKEAVLVETKEGYECWLNYCKHITDVKIHQGGDAPIRDDELVCQNHGAMFSVDSGVCTFGPWKGAKLDPISIAVDSNQIILTDEDYEFVQIGGIDTDSK